MSDKRFKVGDMFFSDETFKGNNGLVRCNPGDVLRITALHKHFVTLERLEVVSRFATERESLIGLRPLKLPPIQRSEEA